MGGSQGKREISFEGEGVVASQGGCPQPPRRLGTSAGARQFRKRAWKPHPRKMGQVLGAGCRDPPWALFALPFFAFFVAETIRREGRVWAWTKGGGWA